MKNFKIIVLIMVFAISISFGGCKLGDKDVYVTTGSGWGAFAINGMKCSKDEAKLYVACFADYYESIGEVEIKTTEESSVIMDGLVKEAALSLISRVYALNVYAKDNEIKLDDKEKEKVTETALKFHELLDNDSKAMISYKTSELEKIYERYAIALKVFDLLQKQSNEEITEDESRVVDAYVIMLNSDEKCGEIESRISRGDDFAVLTQVYSEGEKKQQSFGRNSFPKELEDVVFTLENGQISERINAGDKIYYVKCINKYNEIYSEQNKQKIVKQSQKNLISNIIKEQNENYYSEVNMDFFEELNVSSIRVSCGKEFFELMENALGYSIISMK